jgi:hypothetical protein
MSRSSGPRVVTVNEVLDGHAVLDIQCLDRLYLSGFVQGLQTPGGVVFFLRQIRGMPIASPSLFEQIGTAFRVAMRSFADNEHIPVIRFGRGDRKVDVMRPYLERAPRHARAFFEALVADNLDLGRPESVELIFKRNPGGRKASGVFKTAIDQHTDGVTVNVFYKHSRVKQYLKDGRAMRIETVINDAYDIGCQRLLPNLDEVQTRARAINQRLLDTERVGQGTILASPAFERIAQPTVTDEGRRAPALRFGDPRVQALAGTLPNLLFAASGITNKSLRAQMTALLGTAYSMNQASYDLARLRLNGLINRIPHQNRYTLTPGGQQFAIFYTKVHDRVLRPLLSARDQPNAPPDLRAALRTIEHAIDQRLNQARIRPGP